MRKLLIISILLTCLLVSYRPIDGLLYQNFISGDDIPTDSLRGYWPFSGNANDESGNGHDGTVYGAYIGDSLDRNGQTNKCYYFDGSGDYIAINNDPDFSFTNVSVDSAFSISLWAYSNDVTAKTLIYKGNAAATAREYQIGFPGDATVEFALFDQLTSVYLIKRTTQTFSTGSWIHIVITYSGNSALSGMNIYINGNMATYTTFSNGVYVAMHAQFGDLTFGRLATISSFDFDGKMDDIRIYSKELTAAEVTALYNE